MAFFIVFVGINLINTPEPAGIYALKDLPPASLAPDNGYYMLMALSYPPEVDIAASEVAGEIRKFSDPELLRLNSKLIRKVTKKHNDLFNKLVVRKKEVISQNFSEHFDKIASDRDKLTDFLNANPILMQRYSLLLQADKIEDFSLPIVLYPLINYAAIIKAANFYTANQILTVRNGKWEEGVTGILRQIAFYRKLSANSRQPANKVLSLEMLTNSLKALAYIMNHKNCPKNVFALVLNRLPPLEDSEIGLRNTIIFEFLIAVQGIDEILRSTEPPFQELGILKASLFPSTTDWLNFLARFRIFLNRNRTIQFFLTETNKILQFEKTPPFRWEQDLTNLTPPDPTKRLFWWFSNPIGKVLIAISYDNYQQQIFKKYQTKAFFDLIRICAEFHLKFTLEKPPADIFVSLENVGALDSFSGAPYLYDEKKQILYSIGENRVEDGGNRIPDKRGKPPDLVIPCRFFHGPG